MNRKKCCAIVLSAGKGKRMNADTAKQYLNLCGKPVIYYCLKAFEESFIDDIYIVAGEQDIEYLHNEIVTKYGIKKVRAIVKGGAERYHSVMNGLNAIDDCEYVFIHDGARPFVDNAMLDNAYECVERYKSAIVSVPSKDTIKIVDDDNTAVSTPDRKHVRLMQTPQVFSFAEIRAAYSQMIEKEEDILSKGIVITDDAMVMENFGTVPIKVVDGSYRNIKITTPEDMIIAEAFLTGKS